MKIGLVRRGYSPSGGAEAYLTRFAAAAEAAGHECLLFCTREWPKRAAPLEKRRLKHGKSPLEFALELERAQPMKQCDILLSLERVLACDCYRAGDGVHASWLERRARYEPRWKTWWRRRRNKHHEMLRLEETMFRGETAGSVIANSRLVKEEITRFYGYPAERIEVVHNGAPPPLPEDAAKLARAEIRAKLGLQETDYTLLFAGSGWERKGLRFAIEAINAAAPGVTLLVAGTGKRRRMPRSKRVRYVGAVGDLTRWMAAADAFLLPTLYDPFSNACLEALAAGLPVITTQANGFAELMEPGLDGEALAAPEDILAMAQAIERWRDPARRLARKATLQSKGAKQSVERNVAETLAILQRHYVSPPSLRPIQ